MHSSVLASQFFPKEQEVRLLALLEATPKYAPWGAKQWRAPMGFHWEVVDGTPVPDAVLASDEDNAAVLVLQRYMTPLHIDDDVMVFMSSRSMVPILYIVTTEMFRTDILPINLADRADLRFFPLVDRERILSLAPSLPSMLVGHYTIKTGAYAWVWHPHIHKFEHHSMDWFNFSRPDLGYESIEQLRIDPASGLLVGSGAHIPPFVMSPDGQKLFAFVRTYKDGEIEVNAAKRLVAWTDRLNKQVGKSYAYAN